MDHFRANSYWRKMPNGSIRTGQLAYDKAMLRVILMVILFFTKTVAFAQDEISDLIRFEVPFAGQVAYKSGDYDEAVRQFRSLARKGSVHAQAWLGIMYFEGKGVLKDLVMAYVWLNVSAANGGEVAHVSRNNIESVLDKYELRQALKLSKLCLKKPNRCPEYSK